MSEALPELPHSPLLYSYWTSPTETAAQTLYTADQMREYARAALTPTPQAPQPTAVGELIVKDEDWDFGLSDDYAMGKLQLPQGTHAVYLAAASLPAQAPAVPTEPAKLLALASDVAVKYHDYMTLRRGNWMANGTVQARKTWRAAVEALEAAAHGIGSASTSEPAKEKP